MGTLEVILSSAVTAALINWIGGNKSNRLQFIISEQKKWRKDIKRIIRKIEKSDVTNMRHSLTELKSNLNSYGYHKSNEYPPAELLDFLKDEHIWKEIDELEQAIEKSEDEEVEKHKRTLIYYLLLLLKFNWERSKKEAKVPIQMLSAVITFGLALFFMLLSAHTLAEIKENMYESVVFVILYSMLYFLSWVSYIIEQLKWFRRYKWYKIYESYIISVSLIVYCIYIFNCIIDLGKVEAVIAAFFMIIAYTISLFYPFTRNYIFVEYDEKINEILCTNQITIYAKKTKYLTFRMKMALSKYNLKMEFVDQNICSEISKTLDLVIEKTVSERKQALKILKKRYYPGYIWGNFMNRKNKKCNGNYLKEYIKKKPQSCRIVVKYEKDEKAFYSIGMDGKLWGQWIES